MYAEQNLDPNIQSVPKGFGLGDSRGSGIYRTNFGKAANNEPLGALVGSSIDLWLMNTYTLLMGHSFICAQSGRIVVWLSSVVCGNYTGRERLLCVLQHVLVDDFSPIV